MKIILLIFLVALVQLSAKAQKFEFSVQANTGSAYYGGKSATADSYIIQGQTPDMNYTNNPYGTLGAVSYGAGFKVDFITPKNIIFGLQTDYDVLRSKININGFNFYAVPVTFTTLIALPPPTVTGSTYLYSNFINISPFFGYRIHVSKATVDLLPGIDVGFGLKGREKGNANVSSSYFGNGDYTTDRERQKPPTDIRLRFGIAIKYSKMSFNGSYAEGHSNYMAGMIGGASPQAYSRVLRFGLGYQLN